MANQVDGGDWFRDSVLGQGSFGTVSLWRNNSTAQCIAMKECKFGKQMSEQNRQRWHKEIQIMKKLDHTNVVRAMDLPDGISVPKQDLPPLVLEYCEQGDLRKVLRCPGNSCGLEETKVRDIMADVGAAVEYLHQNKIIHRDLKPENILLKEEDRRIVYKLTDLGYAKDLDYESICHSFVGTMQYLAPELFGKALKYTCTVDYWSFGMIIFECITGVRPFDIQTENGGGAWVQKVMNKQDDHICLDPLTGNFCKNIPDPNHLCKLSRICFESWIRAMLIKNPETRGQGIDSTNQRPMCFKMMESLLSLKRVSVYCTSTNILYTENLNPDGGNGMSDLSTHKDPSDRSYPIRVPVADLISLQSHIPVKQQMYLLEDGTQVPNSELYKYGNTMMYMFDTHHQKTPLDWKSISRLPLVEKLSAGNAKMVPALHQQRAWSHVVFYCHKMYEHFTYMMKACLAALTRLLNLCQACSDIGEEVTEVAIRLHAQANLLLTSVEGDKQYRQSLGKAAGLNDYIAYATTTSAELSRLAKSVGELTSPIKHGKTEASVDDLKCRYKHKIYQIPQKFNSRKSEATAMYGKLLAALRDNKQLMNDDMTKLLKNCIQDERNLSKEMTDFLHKCLYNSGIYKDLKDRQQRLQASQQQLKQLQDEMGQLHQDYQRFKWGQVQELAESSHGNQLMNGEVDPHSPPQLPPDVVSQMAVGGEELCSLLQQSDLDDVHSILADNVRLRETMSSLMMAN